MIQPIRAVSLCGPRICSSLFDPRLGLAFPHIANCGLRIADLSARLCGPNPQSASMLDPWQPWPAQPPFAQDVSRWWPSDEYPPLPPVVMMRDDRAERQLVLASWPFHGGWIDVTI